MVQQKGPRPEQQQQYQQSKSGGPLAAKLQAANNRLQQDGIGASSQQTTPKRTVGYFLKIWLGFNLRFST